MASQRMGFRTTQAKVPGQRSGGPERATLRTHAIDGIHSSGPGDCRLHPGTACKTPLGPALGSFNTSAEVTSFQKQMVAYLFLKGCRDRRGHHATFCCSCGAPCMCRSLCSRPWRSARGTLHMWHGSITQPGMLSGMQSLGTQSLYSLHQGTITGKRAGRSTLGGCTTGEL